MEEKLRRVYGDGTCMFLWNTRINHGISRVRYREGHRHKEDWGISWPQTHMIVVNGSWKG